MNKSAVVLISAALVAGSMLAADAAGTSGAAPPDSTAITAHEAYKLYSGKTWIWSDGAAYFAPDRKFVA